MRSAFAREKTKADGSFSSLLLEEKVLSAAKRMRCFPTLRTMAIPFLHRSTSATADLAEISRFPPAAPVVRRASANTSSVAAYRRAAFPSRGRLEMGAAPVMRCVQGSHPSSSPCGSGRSARCLLLEEKVLSAAKRMRWKCCGFLQRLRWCAAHPPLFVQFAAFVPSGTERLEIPGPLCYNI